MVRAGVVNHPAEWNFSGYNEIQKPRERYALIDYKRLMQLLHIPSIDDLSISHKKWVEEILKAKSYVRQSKWSQSIAVGSKSFVENVKAKLGIRAKNRQMRESGGSYHLRETQIPYNSDFTTENSSLSAENVYFCKNNP